MSKVHSVVTKRLPFLLVVSLVWCLAGCSNQTAFKNLVKEKTPSWGMGTVQEHQRGSYLVTFLSQAFGSTARAEGIPIEAYEYLYKTWGKLKGDEPYFSGLAKATERGVADYGTINIYYVVPYDEDGLNYKKAIVAYQADKNHLTFRMVSSEGLIPAVEYNALDLTHFKGERVSSLVAKTEAGESSTSFNDRSKAVSDVMSRWNLPNNTSENHDAVAVVIGNRNYQGEGRAVPNADFAINDAIIIKEYLVQSLGYSTDNVLYLEDASQADLMSVFGTKDEPQGRLYDKVRKDRSDVFVYYSGHGAPSLSSGRGYLLPVDVDPNKVAINGYSLETLYANLNQVPAKSMTLVVDACFSGSSQSGAVVQNASSISLKVVDVEKKLANASVLTAAGVSEVASWDTEAKHGLFTKYFLDGVTGAADDKRFGDGDGMVTLAELKSYLQEEVPYSARSLYGRDQHPQISGNNGKVFSEVR